MKVLVGGEGVVWLGVGVFGIMILGVVLFIECEMLLLVEKIIEGEYFDDDDLKRVVVGFVLVDWFNFKLGKKFVIVINDVDGELVE